MAQNTSHKTVTLIGATGLIGGHILELLIADPYYDHIKVLTRRPLEAKSAKTEVIVLDFTDLEAYKAALEGSYAVFCSIGTTQKKVKGDLDAYRKIDFDIPVHAARFCKELGCQQFLLVSAVGADSNSGNFYLKLKGEVEDRLKAFGIPSVSIFRPSMLLGNRQEFRLAEKIGQAIMKPLSFLIPSKYKAIEAVDVAIAMVNASKQQKEGFEVYHYKEMKADLSFHFRDENQS